MKFKMTIIFPFQIYSYSKVLFVSEKINAIIKYIPIYLNGIQCKLTIVLCLVLQGTEKPLCTRRSGNYSIIKCNGYQT